MWQKVLAMKEFSAKRRSVAETRRKYGRPETRKEMLERLKKEKEDKKRTKEMMNSIKTKNKDEFHFSYYSIDKNMIKRTCMSTDELKKTLRYVDREISRCEKKVQNRHQEMRSEYEEYMEILKQKKKEIMEKISEKEE